jgi:NAD(P)H dehydrogenase (quinone)
MGLDDWTITMLTSLNQVIAQGYAAAISPALEQITGKPARTFDAFVREYAPAWRA